MAATWAAKESSVPEGTQAGGGAMAGGTLGSAAAALRRVRARARALLLTRGVARLIGWTLLAAIVVGITDYLLRLPTWFRWGLWLIGAAAAIEGTRRWVLPALRFRPSLTSLALRLEGTEAGRRAGLPGVLASAMELEAGESGTDVERALARRAVADAQRRYAAVHERGSLSWMLRPRVAAGAMMLLIAASVVVAGLWTASPRLAAAGAARVLLPWAGVEWPRVTEVVDASAADVHALGTALPLRAAVVRTNEAQGETRVAARYRLVERAGESERVGPVSRRALAFQAAGDAGEMYETLVEPASLPAEGGAGEGAVRWVEYWFETVDDRTEPRRVLLVPPTRIVAARAAIQPPEYAAESLAARGEDSPLIAGERELGPGDDARAVVGPVLAASRVTLRIELSKAVPVPRRPDDESWIARTFPAAEFGEDLAVDLGAGAEAGRVFTLAWTLSATTRVPVAPTDEHGIGTEGEAAYTFEVVSDQEPTGVVIDPPEDEWVLPTAVVRVEGEGRDDIALESLALEHESASPPGGSTGAPAEGRGVRVRAESWTRVPATTTARVATTLDLAPLRLVPGDELWITALAADGFAGAEGPRPPTRSQPRRLRIISEEQLVEQVLGELRRVREAAMRVDDEQRELADRSRDARVGEPDAARQASLTESIARQAASVAQLARRAERNRLGDEALEGLLRDAGALLDDAGRASDDAASRMDTAVARREARGEEAEEPDAVPPDEARDINRAQERVRDQLGQLAQMLDRGEDGWLARREVERLLDQQRELRRRTGEMGDRLVGRDAADMSPDERREAREIAERQSRLADQAREALDELARRAERLREMDPAQAEAMRQAAQGGRQRQVPERMEQAADRVDQNQTAAAQREQDEAIRALEDMLDRMDNTQRTRDEVLRRILATLIESLDRLIAMQDGEIRQLEEAAGALAGLDGGMIRVHEGTIALQAEVNGQMRELAPIAALLGQAAGAQLASIQALRAPDEAAAAGHERESLRLLREARAEAARQDAQAEQREQDRVRRELRQAYRDALEEQVALAAETDPLVGRELDRRERVQVRTVGQRQDGLRERMASVRARTAELEDYAVFAHAHDRLDRVMGEAAKALRAGRATQAVRLDQGSAARILRALVEALDEAQQSADEFRDPEAGGEEQGGGQGEGASQPQPLIPPIAELKLLRGMQQDLADRTRAVDSLGSEAPGAELDDLARAQRDLWQRGRDIIERMEQSQGGTPPGRSDRPGGPGRS